MKYWQSLLKSVEWAYMGNGHMVSRGSLGVLAAVGVLVLAAVNWDSWRDYYSLRSFTPAPAAAQVIDQIALTPKARAILYRAKPQIDSKSAFNVNCETQLHELELGCYYRERVYVLEISNPSLAPEMNVVMAHEMLHAAWSELSGAERDRLTGQLQAAYDRLKDADLISRMASYAKSEPGEEANELHSILGTEIANLPAELEDYYSQYFERRSAVVASHEAYRSVFETRRRELEEELAVIREMKGRLAALNRRMDTLKAANQVSGYNALVPAQNELVDDINARIETYQREVEEYNALSVSLDSQRITDTEPAAQ